MVQFRRLSHLVTVLSGNRPRLYPEPQGHSKAPPGKQRAEAVYRTLIPTQGRDHPVLNQQSRDHIHVYRLTNLLLYPSPQTQFDRTKNGTLFRKAVMMSMKTLDSR